MLKGSFEHSWDTEARHVFLLDAGTMDGKISSIKSLEKSRLDQETPLASTGKYYIREPYSNAVEPIMQVKEHVALKIGKIQKQTLPKEIPYAIAGTYRTLSRCCWTHYASRQVL